MTKKLNDYRYQQTGTTYQLRNFGFGNDHNESGNVTNAPKWVLDIAQLADVAGANLAEYPDVLMWFRAQGQELIEFKFFKHQKYQQGPSNDLPI